MGALIDFYGQLNKDIRNEYRTFLEQVFFGQRCGENPNFKLSCDKALDFAVSGEMVNIVLYKTLLPNVSEGLFNAMKHPKLVSFFHKILPCR